MIDMIVERKTFIKNRILLAAAAPVLWAAAWFYAPYSRSPPPICPLHGLVGLPCPGCGMTRAFCSLAHMNLADALRFNPLVFLFAILLTAGALVALAEIVRGRRYEFYRFLYSVRIAKKAAIGMVAFHLIRVAWFAWTGVLYHEYIRTSWTWSLVEKFLG